MTGNLQPPDGVERDVEHASRSAIVLIGLRGSGKTTVGRAIAARLGCCFVDTDTRIAEQTGLSIAELFAAEGEPGFRRHEREVIEQVAREAPGVISVGGGAVLDAENVKRLRATGKIVWLTAPPQVLWERVSSDSGSVETRPALTNHSGLKELEYLADHRAACYAEAADITVDTAGKAPETIAGEVLMQVDHIID